MKKIFLPILLMILFMTGCADESAPHEKLVIGVDDEFAPMTFYDDHNNLVGFDIDLARETAKRMGVDVEFKSIDWDNKEAEITSGNVDMIWSGCDIMDEYKDYMIFSKPYMDNRQILLIRREDKQNITSLGNLEGKVVGTQAGSNSETYINENVPLKKSFKEFKTYTNLKDGFEALSNGTFDALIIDELAGRYEIMRHPNRFTIAEVTVGPVSEFGIGFRKDDTKLRDRVQKAFNEILKDGTARQISEKWFQADLLKNVR